MDNHSEPVAQVESKDTSQVAMSAHLADDLLSTTADGWRKFYNQLSQRLETVGLANVSFFLNYGYLPTDSNNEAAFDIREGTFNANSVRLVLEVVGSRRPERLHNCRHRVWPRRQHRHRRGEIQGSSDRH